MLVISEVVGTCPDGAVARENVKNLVASLSESLLVSHVDIAAEKGTRLTAMGTCAATAPRTEKAVQTGTKRTPARLKENDRVLFAFTRPVDHLVQCGRRVGR